MEVFQFGTSLEFPTRKHPMELDFLHENQDWFRRDPKLEQSILHSFLFQVGLQHWAPESQETLDESRNSPSRFPMIHMAPFPVQHSHLHEIPERLEQRLGSHLLHLHLPFPLCHATYPVGSPSRFLKPNTLQLHPVPNSSICLSIEFSNLVEKQLMVSFHEKKVFHLMQLYLFPSQNLGLDTSHCLVNLVSWWCALKDLGTVLVWRPRRRPRRYQFPHHRHFVGQTATSFPVMSVSVEADLILSPWRHQATDLSNLIRSNYAQQETALYAQLEGRLCSRLMQLGTQLNMFGMPMHNARTQGNLQSTILSLKDYRQSLETKVMTASLFYIFPLVKKSPCF